MKTGEGKTLVATLSLYLNALTGKGAHLVTVNDYLAKRDAQWISSQEVGPGKKSTVEKLRELKALREEGLVTEEEFERMRGDVLRDF